MSMKGSEDMAGRKAAFLSGRGFELTLRRSGHKHDVIVLKKAGSGS